MCDSGEVEGVDHFLTGCTEFEKGRKILQEELEDRGRLEKSGFKGKVALF